MESDQDFLNRSAGMSGIPMPCDVCCLPQTSRDVVSYQDKTNRFRSGPGAVGSRYSVSSKRTGVTATPSVVLVQQREDDVCYQCGDSEGQFGGSTHWENSGENLKTILLMLSLSFLLISSSCKNKIVGPGDDAPGRRDYVWEVDTVVSPTSYPYKTLYRLWGSSPTDVWAVGAGGDLNSSIFHFDGSRWTTGEYVLIYGPCSIYGFAPNDVYVGGQAGRIWHFDGSSFKEIAALTKDSNTKIVFDNIWGDGPDDIYCFGAYPDEELFANNSVIARFTNAQWTMINTDGLKGIVEHLYKDNADNNIYLQVIKYSNTYDTTFIYEYAGGRYRELYNTIWDKHWATISLINGEVLFVLRTGVSRRVNGEFQTFLNLDNTKFYENIWGRSSKDIFLEMTDGLAHYNGTDVEYLFHYNQQTVGIFAGILFENDVFFLVHEFDTGLSLVYHGTLKK